MSDQNKAAARRVFEAWEQGDLDALDDLVAADANDGREGFKKTIAMYREAFPDLHFEIEDQIAEGDKVVTRWAGTGTHEGTLRARNPTGTRATRGGTETNR